MEEKINVLVVDDEPDIARLFKIRYEYAPSPGQCVWHFAQSGEEALEKLAAQPDTAIVLSDLVMPEMDGLTLLRHIKDRHPYTLTIVVSAVSDMNCIRQAMNAGAFDFIFKPFLFDDLERTLLKAISTITWMRQQAADKEALMSQNTLLRKAIDTVDGIGITITDCEGTIVYTNPAEARMHGYEVQELLGQPVKTLGACTRNGNVPRIYQDYWSRESVNVRKTGEKFPVNLISTQLRDGNGDFLGRITISEELSQYKKREQELKQAVRIITKQLKSKTERFAMANTLEQSYGAK